MTSWPSLEIATCRIHSKMKSSLTMNVIMTMMSPSIWMTIALMSGCHVATATTSTAASFAMTEQNALDMVQSYLFKNDAKHVRSRVLSSSSGTDTSTTITREEPPVYLALGDSIPAGTKDRDPSWFVTTTPFRLENSYPQFLLDKVNEIHPDDEMILLNLSCPGDSSSAMLDPNLQSELTPVGSACYGSVAPFALASPSISELASNYSAEEFASLSQLDAAKFVLQTQNVAFVTLQVGGNDFLQACPTSMYASDPDELRKCVQEHIPVVIANLYIILGSLKSVAPKVPILVANYYVPFLAYFLVGVPEEIANLAAPLWEVTIILDAIIEEVVKSVDPLLANVKLVNLKKLFKTTDFTPDENEGIPRNVLEICKYTFMCKEDQDGNYEVRFDPNPDLHLNRRGHRKVARAFFRALEDVMEEEDEHED